MMDETEIKRVRNVYRLTESPIQGEANAALAMTKKLLSAHGKKMSDLPDILGGMSSDSRAKKPLVEEEYFRAAAAAAVALRRKGEAEAAARRAEWRREAANARAAALATIKAAEDSDDRIRLRL